LLYPIELRAPSFAPRGVVRGLMYSDIHVGLALLAVHRTPLVHLSFQTSRAVQPASWQVGVPRPIGTARAKGREVDYDLLVAQVRSLLADESDFIANAANFAAFIYNELPDLNWAGFYFPTASGELVLGPFSGRPACTRLPKGRGVCGAAFTSGETVVVDDVHAFADHIVCDSASASEIVVPLRTGDRITGVFDVDSPRLARFSEADRIGIERLVKALVSALRREAEDPAVPYPAFAPQRVPHGHF
jgi:L-methionine (R)-S-oxide reductase